MLNILNYRDIMSLVVWNAENWVRMKYLQICRFTLNTQNLTFVEHNYIAITLFIRYIQFQTGFQSIVIFTILVVVSFDVLCFKHMRVKSMQIQCFSGDESNDYFEMVHYY